MPRKSVALKSPRIPLSEERILKEALRQADLIGVEAVSMRKVAQALGVEAMSLYNHIANKEQMLNGMVELVMSEIYSPNTSGDWKSELRKRGVSFHLALLKHPWAAPLMESRGSGDVQLGKHNAVLGCLRRAGFSISLAHRALLTIDSYLYGFAFQETTWPYERDELPEVIAKALPQVSAEKYPHLVELMQYMSKRTRGKRKPPKAHATTPAYQEEFEFGLDMILDGFASKMGS
jgi:AcrR family transcriptional regulator